jgi:RNA polymerase primary sigma factor
MVCVLPYCGNNLNIPMRQLVISKSITQRNYQSLDKYFNEIDKIELLTIQQEVDLARRIRGGDKDALDRLTKTNLRFVVSVAKQYQHKGLSLGDLINEGNLGLITAAKRYDETRGFKFISYAVWWIRQSIIAAIAEQSRIVHLPYNHVTSLNKFYNAVSKLEQRYNRQPSLEEISQYLEMSVEKIIDLFKFSAGSISIDQPLSSDGEFTLHDVLCNEQHTDQEVMNSSIMREIKCSLTILNKRDRELLTLFFGLGGSSTLALEDVAHRLKLSVEHTRRLKDNALARLRNSSYAPVLKSCLC